MHPSSRIPSPLTPVVRRAFTAACAALALACASAPTAAQAAQPPASFYPTWTPAMDSAAAGLRVVLVTMGPGDEVWEKFGHNALWVHDPRTGEEIAYNYGMFDFRQANFYSNFARGHMRYWMQGFDALATLDFYGRQNRSVWLQELNLTPRQKAEIKAFLEWNARDDNRYYRYDYYRDNCSTRVRDAIDRVIGGGIRRQFSRVPVPVTFRSETERLTADDVVTYTGLMIGLAEPADVPISAWDEMFLPMRLRDHVRETKVPDAQGRMVPLVRSERVAVAAAGREPERSAPPNRIPAYLVAGLLLAALVAGLGWAAPRRGGARIGYAIVTGLWTLLTGVGGVVLASLWLFTDHAIAYRNENLFQFDPISLPLVLLLPALVQGKRWSLRPAPRIALVVAALSVLGFVVQVLPGVDQVNGIVIALALPVNLALAWTAAHLARAHAAAPAVADASMGDADGGTRGARAARVVD
ncbi:MAG TPA: DUF4105 domain-containing protein [Longimicrobiaceae bacterium]|nr:DUF4105 domain-containing protein [Longimicrobiaceae bacterium]